MAAFEQLFFMFQVVEAGMVESRLGDVLYPVALIEPVLTLASM
jgi:hypothetical protein